MQGEVLESWRSSEGHGWMFWECGTDCQARELKPDSCQGSRVGAKLTLGQSQRPKEGKDGIARWGHSDSWQEFGRRGKNPQVEAPSRKNFRANPNIEAGCWSSDCHCRGQQRLAPSTSSKLNVNLSSVSAGDNFEIVGQNDNCVQRREWGSLRLDRALTMYQSPLRISLKGLTCPLWACQLNNIQLMPLYLDASVLRPGRLRPRDSFSEATLFLSHTSSQCLLLLELNQAKWKRMC